jgi:hypothetical protein
MQTLERLNALATGCMESACVDVQERHRGAGASARAYAATGRAYHQGAEARALLDAVELDQWHRDPGGSSAGKPMTTAELLMVAAIIAARAEGEPMPFRQLDAEPIDNRRQEDSDPLPLDVDSEGMNDRRAGWARAALETFQAETGTDDGDAICDLVADLFHLCDRDGETFGRSARTQIERGARAYEQEGTDEAPEEIDAGDVVGAWTETRPDPLRAVAPTGEEA